MTDFGKHGRFGDISERDRRRILTLVAKAVMYWNVFTLAVTLEHSAYLSVFPPGFDKYLSQYAACFLGCVLGNHQIAKANGYKEPVAFILDSGNKHAAQVLQAYMSLFENQRNGKLNLSLGSLNFEDDRRVAALQAADVVCWCVRRRVTGKKFNNGFEPLEQILFQPGHNHSPFPEDAMRGVLEMISERYPEVLRNETTPRNDRRAGSVRTIQAGS